MAHLTPFGYDEHDARANGRLVDALERGIRAMKWLAQQQIAVLGVESNGQRTRIIIKPCGRCRQLRSVWTKKGICAAGYFETRVALVEQCEVMWTMVQSTPFSDHDKPALVRVH